MTKKVLFPIAFLAILGYVSFGVLACSGAGNQGDQVAADTLSRRQKDSILSTLPVPGAGAVGRALEASDKARARAEQMDTIG